MAELNEQGVLLLQLMKEQFDGFKTEINHTLKQKGDKSVVEKPRFKNPGNERQFVFNSDIMKNLEDILESQPVQSTPEALEIVNGLLRKLAKRNKLIRLSDSSEAGWGFAAEYEANQLASDEDDELKIREISIIFTFVCFPFLSLLFPI